MKIKSVQTLVSEALKHIKTINSEDAFKKFDQNECNLIDLRDIRELQNEGQVEGANHIPRGMLEFWLDPESPYYKSELNDTEEVILFCNGGWRSALAAASLKEMGIENVAHMTGGFGGWQKEIGKTIELSSSKK